MLLHKLPTAALRDSDESGRSDASAAALVLLLQRVPALLLRVAVPAVKDVERVGGGGGDDIGVRVVRLV